MKSGFFNKQNYLQHNPDPSCLRKGIEKIMAYAEKLNGWKIPLNLNIRIFEEQTVELNDITREIASGNQENMNKIQQIT